MKKTLLAAVISAVLSVVITVCGMASASFVTADGRGACVASDATDKSAYEAAESEPYIPGGIFSGMQTPKLGSKRILQALTGAEKTDVLPPDTDAVTDTETETEAATEPVTEPLPEFILPEYPSDSTPALLTVNGKELPRGFAAVIGGVMYFPLDEFCRSFGETVCRTVDEGCTVTGDGFEVCAAVGDSYITSRGRVLWCGTGAEVMSAGDVLCVPAEPLCRALGVALTVDGSTAEVIGEASSKSADEVYDSDSLYWLSHIISAESRGEPLAGQIAVGCVVLNRLRTLDYLSCVYDVVFDRRYGIQFSPAYSGSVYNEPTESCVRAAKICLEGYSVSNSILYFINSADTPPAWMVNGCELIVTIGHHDFYA